MQTDMVYLNSTNFVEELVGTKRSNCILLYEHNLNKIAEKRLRVLKIMKMVS